MPDDLTQTLDVHDSEINEIHQVLTVLRERANKTHNFDSFQREIIDRFYRIGFVVDVRWYETNQASMLMPEINISGRVDKDFVFDRDRQVSEVTSDVLGLGEGGVLKIDRDMAKALEEGTYKGQSGHQH